MTTEKTAVALRILMAVNKHEKPADIDALLLYLLCPGCDDMEPDELACVVVREAFDARKKSHVLATSPGAYFG